MEQSNWDKFVNVLEIICTNNAEVMANVKANIDRSEDFTPSTEAPTKLLESNHGTK